MKNNKEICERGEKEGRRKYSTVTEVVEKLIRM